MPKKSIHQTDVLVKGKVVANLDDHFILVKTAKTKKTTKQPEGESARILAAVGEALSRPGISKKAVFGVSNRRVYAYSLDPDNPKRFIREARDGTRRVGTMVNGKFRALAHA